MCLALRSFDTNAFSSMTVSSLEFKSFFSGQEVNLAVQTENQTRPIEGGNGFGICTCIFGDACSEGRWLKGRSPKMPVIVRSLRFPKLFAKSIHSQRLKIYRVHLWVSFFTRLTRLKKNHTIILKLYEFLVQKN